VTVKLLSDNLGTYITQIGLFENIYKDSVIYSDQTINLGYYITNKENEITDPTITTQETDWLSQNYGIVILGAIIILGIAVMLLRRK
jgi:hypothetical protein